MNLDDASNGIFLRIPDGQISTMSRHQGFHSVYNDVVSIKLDQMEINKSIHFLEEEVFKLQSNLKLLQERGLPLYKKHGATMELWIRELDKL